MKRRRHCADSIIPYPAFVPKTDADGKEIAGGRLPELEVPLATYAGWNRRAANLGGI